MPNEISALVYFLAKSNFGDNQPDFIKIGRTKTDLPTRQTALQTGNEAKLWEIGVIAFDSEDDASREEKRIHSQFGAFRAEGEWFIATPRLLEFIDDYAVLHTDLFTEEDTPETENTTEEDTTEISFGKQLAEARKSKDMTQVDLANKVGYSRGHIALIEQDRGRPGRDLYRILCELFPDSLEPPTETILGSLFGVEMEN